MKHYKKFFTLILAGVLLLGLAACGGKPGSGTPPAMESTIEPPPLIPMHISLGGVKLELGANPAQALAALGKPRDFYESPGYAHTEMKVIHYKYEGFSFTVACPEYGDRYIVDMTLTDDRYSTPDGFAIGSTSYEEIVAAYGGDFAKASDDVYIYTRGRNNFQFDIQDGLVLKILYYVDMPPPANYSAEKDGLLLTVTLPSVVQAGNEFLLRATISNQSDEDILYRLPSSTEGMHLEIRVSIKANGTEFIDADTYGVPMNEEAKQAILKAGEQFVQAVRFLPGSPNDSSYHPIDQTEIAWFSPGTYQGTATFRWGGDPSYYYTTSNTLRVDFPVVIS